MFGFGFEKRIGCQKEHCWFDTYSYFEFRYGRCHHNLKQRPHYSLKKYRCLTNYPRYRYYMFGFGFEKRTGYQREQKLRHKLSWFRFVHWQCFRSCLGPGLSSWRIGRCQSIHSMHHYCKFWFVLHWYNWSIGHLYTLCEFLFCQELCSGFLSDFWFQYKRPKRVLPLKGPDVNW